MCNAYREWIMRAVDKMLSPEEEEKLVAHLNVCETCRREYEMQQQIREGLKSWQQKELPEGFHEKLMHEVRKEKKRHWKWQAVSAAAACLFIGSALFYQMEQLGMKSELSEDPNQYKVSIASRMAEEEMIDEKGQVWHLACSDAEKMKEQTASFLQEEGIAYRLRENEIIIMQVTDEKKLYDWLQDRKVQVLEETDHTPSTTLHLLFEVAP